jgi:transposase
LGQTPGLSVPKSYEHLSVICALTEDYRLYWHCQERAYNGKGKDIAHFLRDLSRKLGRKLLIIWDGARIHFSQPVRDWLCQAGAGRIWLEKLPAYAPELNPTEQVWRHLKNVGLANFCAKNLAELKQALAQALDKLAPKRKVFKGFLKHVGFRV